MSFNPHIETITNKAFSMLGFVLRTCKPFKKISTLKTIYSAYVRSNLEYCSNIWSPCYIKPIEAIERIQRKFIKHLNFRTYFESPDYKESCKHYKIQTCGQRRQIADMLVLYDIINAKIDSPNLLSKIKLVAPPKRTRHTSLLRVPFKRKNYSQNSAITRMTRTYNKHYSDIDLFRYSKKTFKRHISQLH